MNFNRTYKRGMEKYENFVSLLSVHRPKLYNLFFLSCVIVIHDYIFVSVLILRSKVALFLFWRDRRIFYKIFLQCIKLPVKLSFNISLWSESLRHLNIFNMPNNLFRILIMNLVSYLLEIIEFVIKCFNLSSEGKRSTQT